MQCYFAVVILLLLAIPGAAESLQDEWLPFAIQLAASMNCVCVLVNLNTIARPWITKDIISALSIQVLHNTLKAKQAIILGKSYGGLLANEFAMQHQQQVTALILFAPATPPAFSVERLCTLQPRIPIFLGWSKNDASYSHHGKYVEQCDAKDKFFMFHSEYYGEHAITKEYFAPMMEFLNLHIPRLV